MDIAKQARLEELKRATAQFVDMLDEKVKKHECGFFTEMVRDTFDRYNEICVQNDYPLGITALTMCVRFTGTSLGVMFTDRYDTLSFDVDGNRELKETLIETDVERSLNEHFTSVTIRELTESDPPPPPRDKAVTWDEIAKLCQEQTTADHQNAGFKINKNGTSEGSPYGLLSVLITSWFLQFSDMVPYLVDRCTDDTGREFTRIQYINAAGVIEIRHNWGALQKNFMKLRTTMELHESKRQGGHLH